MIIGVDFDGTLCEHKYPEIGNPYLILINTLKQLRNDGHKLILWTCRDGKKLNEAVEWCESYNLYFDAVNDDLQEIKDTFTYKSKKVYADIYIDDRNFCFECNNLEEI